jgi:hypothetical protein
MKTQIKYTFFLCIIFIPKIAYTMEQEHQILSLMCKPLTDPIPCKKITRDDYMKLILERTEALQGLPSINKMVELIETFKDAKENIYASCKDLGISIYNNKPQSPLCILASLIADQMEDYFKALKEGNYACLTKTRLVLYAIKQTQQDPQSNAHVQNLQLHKKAAFLLLSTNNLNAESTSHDTLSMKINQLLLLDNQILEVMAQKIYSIHCEPDCANYQTSLSSSGHF